MTKLRELTVYLPGAALLLGWNVLLWGLVALWPGSMFNTSPIYRYYENYAPEAVWGAGFALAGIVQILFVRRGGFVAWLAAALLSAAFAFVAYLLMRASFAAPSGYIALLQCATQIAYTGHVARSRKDGD